MAWSRVHLLPPGTENGLGEYLFTSSWDILSFCGRTSVLDCILYEERRISTIPHTNAGRPVTVRKGGVFILWWDNLLPFGDDLRPSHLEAR